MFLVFASSPPFDRVCNVLPEYTLAGQWINREDRPTSIGLGYMEYHFAYRRRPCVAQVSVYPDGSFVLSTDVEGTTETVNSEHLMDHIRTNVCSNPTFFAEFQRTHSTAVVRTMIVRGYGQGAVGDSAPLTPEDLDKLWDTTGR